MNNQILLGLVTIGLVASVVGVGTWAYFSDTETSMGNTMAAGTLDLTVNGENPLVSRVVNLTDMKPSKEMPIQTVNLLVESNPGRLYKMITDISCNNGVSSEPERDEEGPCTQDDAGVWSCDDEVYDLASTVFFDLTVDDVVCIPFGGTTAEPTSAWTVESIAGQWIYLGTVAMGDNLEGTMVVDQSFHMNAHAGNEYQGDACTFTEVFQLEQMNAPMLKYTVNCTPVN